MHQIQTAGNAELWGEPFETARPSPDILQEDADAQAQLGVHTPDDWLRLFEEEQVQFIILDQRTDAELLTVIHSQPGWIVDFEDDQAVIFALRRNKL
ncbi:MAG: hypothetical protein JXA33_10260 [Anaerolineae bacterium]|nr:hypothetical protein [Anaerolineae bacterium]